MPDPTPRRRQLAEAATAVVAREGLRGLTHRAVDREAGIAEGSCSAYLRTSRALRDALTEHVAGSMAADVEDLAAQVAALPPRAEGAPPGPALDLAMALMQRWVDRRDLVVVSLELSTAATRDPAIAEQLAPWRARLVDVVDAILAAAGRPHSTERADALVAAYDGILAAALLRPDDERRAWLARTLTLVTDALTCA
ncbi:MAG: TetR/AcrR family transcriptional regulator [Nocardioides sp.]|uniref:TetR/AcrR family transcriptional regulator n=1 Tax=Nocardioides sp. Leaf307 TaxID=1736331 RepID=UPI0007039675|nr:TetR/AcrR family transcriptional regulator [Nocardioides sp. Leaf307]KQQ43211.1 hypothetical protein ASF50_04345 [Nocardioides sp. Leaf307]MBJ7530207.1 TetR/AcrR family transcriptional regulator [Nocardioides sp.]